jgi:predicted transcriptional regulator
MGYLSVVNKEELARSANLPIATIRRVAAGSNYNIETLLKITSAIDRAT